MSSRTRRPSKNEQRIRALVKAAAQIKRRRRMSNYRIANDAGVNLNVVTRLFSGYERLGSVDVSEPERPGRINLTSAMAIFSALGCKLELVDVQGAADSVVATRG